MGDDNPSAPNRRTVVLAAALSGAAGAAGAAAGAAEAPPAGGASFGKGPDDAALRAGWKAFCRRLEEAGDLVFKSYSPPAPLQRADAFRFLTQNLSQAFDLGLESKDTRYPLIHAFCTPLRKLGADNADCLYQQAWIDGESVYRIVGNKGTVKVLNVTVQGPKPERQPGTGWPTLHEPFGDVPQANLFGHELHADADGNFELYIGGPQRGPNWLPTTAGSRKLFIRQVFDRWDETTATLRIERVGMTTPRPVPTPQDMITAMAWAGDFVKGTLEDWPEAHYKYMASHDIEHLNEFPYRGDDGGKDKQRGRAIINMSWKIAPDEALIIEFAYGGGLWMVTNMGEFFNSMDFIYRPVSYTTSRTKVDSDGSVRLILAHDDPGYHNWVDTQGFEKGNITYRHYLSEEIPQLRTRLVKRSQLAAALPADTARVTPDQRIAQMHERFAAIMRRYALL